jgi:RNA polymerase sigma-70 factor (ECF subfamily)
MMLRKKRQSREVSLDESTEAGESSIPLQIPDRRPTPEQYASQRELQDVLGQAVAELPSNLRIAVELRDLQELTTEEATQVLGVTVTALKSRLFHARTRLRQVLSSGAQPKRQRAVGSAWKMPPLQPEVP